MTRVLADISVWVAHFRQVSPELVDLSCWPRPS